MHAEVCNLESRIREAPADNRSRRDPESGQYSTRTIRGWERTPIVEQFSPKQAESLWADYVETGGEGLVVVALEAPVGKRNAKRKVKPTDTIDALVVRVEGRLAECDYGGNLFTVGLGKHRPAIGQLVAVKYDGWYESGVTPRFPRIGRVRSDLA